MDFKLTKEQEEFKKEVHEFLRKEVTEQVVEEFETEGTWGPATWELVKKVGSRGWLTPHWPKEYGGLGLSLVEWIIVANELVYWRASEAFVGAHMAGPVIMRRGNEEQKKEYLPRIARGEIEFALGYTEPQAGSDLSSLEIRAVEDGDDYVLNGQKMFNTASHFANYHWLGARTDTTASKKHRGISLFIVDLTSPGITIRPLWVMDGLRTNEVFYDNVRVPKKNMVGEKNHGFYYIMEALDHERIFPHGELWRVLEELTEYVKDTGKNEDPLVRQKLAEMAIEVKICDLLAYHVAWMLSQKISCSSEVSVLKNFHFETRYRMGVSAMEILGLYGQLQRDSKWAVLRGKIDWLFRGIFWRLIGGGTSEIQRNIIATRGLGLPAH